MGLGGRCLLALKTGAGMGSWSSLLCWSSMILLSSFVSYDFVKLSPLDISIRNL
jgi:hypothetical protein